MEKVQNVLYQLQKSINSLKIDYELLERLKTQISTKPIQPDSFEQQIKLLLQLYDLSNNEKLYIVRKTSISMNEMAVQLKIMVCRLMSIVISYFERQQYITLIPIQFLAEGIQIMILSVRVCLNEGQNKFISQLQECYNFIHSPCDYVSEFLPKNIQFYHHLNVLQLTRYNCENQSFTIMDFQKRLAIISSYQEFSLPEYSNFVSYIVMEIVLKSLKNGKLPVENIENFFPFLSDQNQKELLSLITATGNSTKNLQTSSEFLEIYYQLKNYGVQSINWEYLEEFIKNQKNFNDERIFQVTALTFEPDVLEIWFRVLNTKKEKSPLLQKAFLCYIHVVESILGKKDTQRSQNLSKLLKLSNTIIFTLLTQKKSNNSQQPVLNVIKTLLKVLTDLCFCVDKEWKEINDFGERIVLICSRFQCMQISKIIYTLLLYCSLIMKQHAEDIYKKFQAHYNNDKSSQIYRLLSTAYLVRNSHQSNLDIESIKSLEMFKQPFIMILFAQNQEDMTIFDIDIKDFKQMNSKFQIYFEMIKKYEKNQVNLQKILEHLETFVLKMKLEQLSKIIEESIEQKTNLQHLMMFLIEFLEQHESNNFQHLKTPSIQGSTGKYQQASSNKINDHSNEGGSSIKICFILINFFILSNPLMVGELKEVSGGVLLNKYSQKVKMITALVQMVRRSNFQIEAQLYNICCCYLIIVLEKFKKSFVKKQRIGEPGQVSFIHAIQEFVTLCQQIEQRKVFETEKQINSQNGSKQRPYEQSNDIKKNFISFIIFQIDCLTNNHERYIKAVDQMQINQMRTYSHSVYIPKPLKQKILRRIVRQNLMQKGQQVTLRQFKEIIEITEDQEELQLYMKYVLCSFGEEGRRMLLLIAHQNKRLQRILLRDTEIEI